MAHPPPIATECPGCRAQLGPELLACPSCGRLVHGERLGSLAEAARGAAAVGDASAELAAWREALDLLPEDSRQHSVVLEKVDRLSRAVDGGGRAGPREKQSHGAVPKWLASIGVLGLLLWKFKFIAVFVLTKGKLLLLGLTKSSTFFSMFLAMGVYWTVWGWKFALGIILSIYVHEMGHVAALNRFGFKASAPMFIPGVGALIRMRQHPVNAKEDARIGLAGPIWGLGAAVACLVLWWAMDHPIFAALAHFGAWINLFNLIPLGPLDGGRGFRPMSRGQRWLAVGSLFGSWLVIHDGLMILLAIVGVVRAFADKGDPQGDWVATAQYVALVAALSAIVYYAPVLVEL